MVRSPTENVSRARKRRKCSLPQARLGTAPTPTSKTNAKKAVHTLQKLYKKCFLIVLPFLSTIANGKRVQSTKKTKVFTASSKTRHRPPPPPQKQMQKKQCILYRNFITKKKLLNRSSLLLLLPPPRTPPPPPPHSRMRCIYTLINDSVAGISHSEKSVRLHGWHCHVESVSLSSVTGRRTEASDACERFKIS